MEKYRSPAVIAAMQKLGVRPVITALEAGLFVFLLWNTLQSAPAGEHMNGWFLSRILLAAAVFFLFLGSLCGTVSAVRDLKAARSGAERQRSRIEKTLPVVFCSLAAALLIAALIIGTNAQKAQAGQQGLHGYR